MAAEIGAVLREIQERVRSRHPQSGPNGFPLPDLLPVVHARDRAEGKVAAIGLVNPRPPGAINNLIQWVKRNLARSLNWMVRDQVEFNRAMIDVVQAQLEAMNETNRALVSLSTQVREGIDGLRQHMDHELRHATDQFASFGPKVDALSDEAKELKDVRTHWAQWRQEWERKLSINEIQFLRSVADLQSAYQHRLTQMEGNFRETVAMQHRDYAVALDKARIDIQERFWKDWDKARNDFEKLIHNELRVIRQRSPVGQASRPAGDLQVAPSEPPIDFLAFADRFRGQEHYVRQTQARHLEHFRNATEILDIGCGRGEFLQVLKDAGKLAKGIEASDELVAICRHKGLYAEHADLFDYLRETQAHSLDGIFAGQVIEHLPPHRLPEFIALAHEALRPGGVIVLETPNPGCLAIFATHFYLDPTHQRPVPAQLAVFYLEEAGFGKIQVDYLNPAAESLEGLQDLPASFREAFFGGLDYAVAAVKL
ncbi:MAG: methyltransferase domain-containing protein [Bryobacterales bacterium]|nr:methyltransferase domain-containing protein [Bryobacterales bacterium]